MLFLTEDCDLVGDTAFDSSFSSKTRSETLHEFGTKEPAGGFHQTDNVVSARAAFVPTTVPSATPGNVILVTGIKSTTDEGLLRLFFQSRRRSGGGPVDEVMYKRFKGEATITFKKTEGNLYMPYTNYCVEYRGHK